MKWKVAGAIFAAVLSLPAHAQQSGEAVYKSVCMVCHAAGVANAPRFGDAKAWAPRIGEGQATLTAHAWVGLGAMPARGGSPNLSLEDFAKAVVHMANAGGAKWKDPDAKMLSAIREEEKKRIAELARKK